MNSDVLAATVLEAASVFVVITVVVGASDVEGITVVV